MSELQSHDPNKTSVMGYPILTAADIQALHEQPDHGITRATEIVQFASIDDWKARGGAGVNFWMRFKPDMLGGAHREPQWVQRFIALYPELDETLIEAARNFRPDKPFDEETEQLFFDAYGKMAELVGQNDAGVNNSLPKGQVEPYLLLN